VTNRCEAVSISSGTVRRTVTSNANGRGAE
jgi:hypothetical protein